MLELHALQRGRRADGPQAEVASLLPTWIQFLRLWKAFHKRNYEQSRIRQSLARGKCDFRRWALDIAEGATPAVFA